MWHSPWLLSLIALTGAVAPALATETSLGPTSASEAKILWNESQTALAKNDCEDASPALERLVDRYPGYPGAVQYRESRYQLARCQFLAGKNEKALAGFRAYIEGAGDRPHLSLARVFLGESLIRLGKYAEAELVAAELEKSGEARFRIEGLCLRALALVRMNKDDSARTALVSALSESEKSGSRELMSKSQLLSLEMKTRDCGRLPEKKMKTLDEASVKKAMEERGECLDEALIQFRKVLSFNSAGESDEAERLILRAYRDYQGASQSPPNPPALKPKNRNKAELAQYRAELTEQLGQTFETHRKNALKFIQNWKSEKPSPNESAQSHLNQLEEALQ